MTAVDSDSSLTLHENATALISCIDDRLTHLAGRDQGYTHELKRLRAVVVVLRGAATLLDNGSNAVEVRFLEAPLKRMMTEVTYGEPDAFLLEGRRRDLTLQIGEAIDDARSKSDDDAAREILSKLSIELAGLSAHDVLSDAAAISQARTETEETAGDVAESELAKEFTVYGKRQDVVGYIWLGFAVALFGVTVAVALMVLKQVGQAFNWYSLASHLLIALPCLGLGAYCARESSRHRELAQWARRLAVQLKVCGCLYRAPSR